MRHSPGWIRRFSDWRQHRVLHARKSRPKTVSRPFHGAKEGMQNLRHERVRELLKREVGEAIHRELPIDQAGMIKANGVGGSNYMESSTTFVGVVRRTEER